MALTDTELAMLELERSWFTVAGTKDEAKAPAPAK